MVVGAALQKLGLHPAQTLLGEVELEEETLPEARLQEVDKVLRELGFELIGDRKSRLIEQVKQAVIRLVHYDEAQPLKHSAYIAAAVGQEYGHLSKLFSDVEGITVEQYLIRQKIERVKELLVYGDLTLTEIARQTGYSSVAHLSSQFRKVTGLTPTHFRQVKDKKRLALDKVGKEKS